MGMPDFDGLVKRWMASHRVSSVPKQGFTYADFCEFQSLFEDIKEERLEADMWTLEESLRRHFGCSGLTKFRWRDETEDVEYQSGGPLTVAVHEFADLVEMVRNDILAEGVARKEQTTSTRTSTTKATDNIVWAPETRTFPVIEWCVAPSQYCVCRLCGFGECRFGHKRRALTCAQFRIVPVFLSPIRDWRVPWARNE